MKKESENLGFEETQALLDSIAQKAAESVIAKQNASKAAEKAAEKSAAEAEKPAAYPADVQEAIDFAANYRKKLSEEIASCEHLGMNADDLKSMSLVHLTKLHKAAIATIGAKTSAVAANSASSEAEKESSEPEKEAVSEKESDKSVTANAKSYGVPLTVDIFSKEVK